MDTHALHAFVTVAQEKSFSKAAERLFITQPAISKRIAALEDQLGTLLFNRIHKQVSLTEAGVSLLPRAQALLLEVEDMRRFASTLHKRVQGTLTIATSHHIGLRRLPPLLKRFNQKYQDVELNLRFMDSEQACQAVEKGEIELAIVTLPDTPPRALFLEYIWTDRLLVVADDTHPLAKKNALDLQQLAAHPCVLPSANTYTFQILHAYFSQHTLDLNVRMSSNYLETLKMLTSSGFGWSLLPHTMLDAQLCLLDIDLPLTRQLGIVTHRQRTLSQAAHVLREMLREMEEK